MKISRENQNRITTMSSGAYIASIIKNVRWARRVLAARVTAARVNIVKKRLLINCATREPNSTSWMPRRITNQLGSRLYNSLDWIAKKGKRKKKKEKKNEERSRIDEKEGGLSN